MPRACGLNCRARGPILEHPPGRKSSCAMSIENLNTAVRAAGFAMAASDEPSDEGKTDRHSESEAWRPGEAILLTQDEVALGAHGKPRTIAGRLKGVFGLFGRSAPA